VSGLEVDPAQLSRAANALDDIVRGDYERAAARIRRSCQLAAPGLGTTLGSTEAYYNDVADYHARNLQAAAAAVGEIADGLRATVRNVAQVEAAHSEMLLARPVADDPAQHGHSAAVATAGRDLPQWAIQSFDVTPHDIGLRTQNEFLRISFATAGMAPAYLPTPVAVSGLVSNLESILATARDLAAVAASLQTDVNARFDQYTAEATLGWVDDSVEAYRAVVATMSQELARARKTIDAMAATLMSVYTLLESFWAAFMTFTAQFFSTVVRMRLDRTGPQSATVESTLRTVAAAASEKWLAAQRTVLDTVSGAITQLGDLASDVTTGRVTPGSPPTIQRVTIAWPSA
jgi:uncharacterized protein YukE